MHAILATVPLNADFSAIEQVAVLHGKIMAASAAEIAAATSVVEATLRHEIMQRAAECERRGHCRRETPVTLLQGNVLIEGVVDLAFEERKNGPSLISKLTKN